MWNRHTCDTSLATTHHRDDDDDDARPPAARHKGYLSPGATHGHVLSKPRRCPMITRDTTIARTHHSRRCCRDPERLAWRTGDATGLPRGARSPRGCHPLPAAPPPPRFRATSTVHRRCPGLAAWNPTPRPQGHQLCLLSTLNIQLCVPRTSKIQSCVLCMLKLWLCVLRTLNIQSCVLHTLKIQLCVLCTLKIQLCLPSTLI